MTIQADQKRQQPPAIRRRNRALGVAGSVVAATVIWVVGEPVLGHELVIEQPGQDPMDLGVNEVVFMSLAASLLAWALLALLERLSARAMPIWTTIAVVVLIASFIPFVGVEATTGTKLVLALTHVVVAAVLVPVFRRTAGAKLAIAGSGD